MQSHNVKYILVIVVLFIFLMTTCAATQRDYTQQLIRYESVLPSQTEVELYEALFYKIVRNPIYDIAPISTETERHLDYLSDRIYYLENKSIITFDIRKLIEFLPVQLHKRIR